MKKVVLVTCFLSGILFCGITAIADFQDNFEAYADGNLDVVSSGI